MNPAVIRMMETMKVMRVKIVLRRGAGLTLEQHCNFSDHFDRDKYGERFVSCT